MEQYGVHTLKGQDGLFLTLHYPGLDVAGTVVVAPLVPLGMLPEIPVLTPRVDVDGDPFLLLTYRLAAIDARRLERTVTHLLGQDYDISRALSRLFFGN